MTSKAMKTGIWESRLTLVDLRKEGRWPNQLQEGSHSRGSMVLKD